jgi:hypothetical protein
MKQVLKTSVKRLLSKVLPDNIRFQILCSIPRLETWRKKHNEVYPYFKSRYQLYDHLNTKIIKNAEINYLEFGVYKGDSIKYWSNINKCDKSLFWGFDTFHGLNEDWNNFELSLKKGTFNVNGNIPDINDNRISFIKGLFQDTLPSFLIKYNPHSQIVIHNDSDLYSSTLFTLTQCNSLLVQGSIIVFDEFSSILNEFRALDDYCISYIKKYEVVGATVSKTNYYQQIAIKIL